MIIIVRIRQSYADCTFYTFILCQTSDNVKCEIKNIGQTFFILTLALFKPPLLREVIMSTGMCNVSRESCEYILKEKGPGNSICIIVGGAPEALDAHSNQDYRLVVKPRKGFIKLALRTG